MSIGAVPAVLSTRSIGREDLDNVIEADLDGCAGQLIEVCLCTDEVERTVDVCVLLRRRQAESRRRCLELEERPEWRLAGCWRTVVVAIDDVALVGLALNFPHRVHISRGVGRP